MLKKATTYLVLFVLMANIMGYQCIYVYFKSHQKFVAENLCVKKEIKNNDCQGKCHLKKMAKSAEPSTTKILHELKADFICHNPVSFNFQRTQILEKTTFYKKNEPSTNSGFKNGIYAPPDFLLSV